MNSKKSIPILKTHANFGQIAQEKYFQIPLDKPKNACIIAVPINKWRK